MYSVIAHLAHEHNLTLVIVAALICIAGCCLTVLLARRMIRATKRRQMVQLGLTSIMSGATIWSTHFIAMLAYDPGFEHAYEPFLTGFSLAVAIIGTFSANSLLTIGTQSRLYPMAGVVFGLTVSTMHVLGMTSYQLPGEIVWDYSRLFASVIIGVSLGALSFYRIARPVTRYCWMGGALLMVLAICSMHFTAMSAFEVKLNPLFNVPPQVISDVTLGILIVSVMAVFMLIGFASVSIELNLENEAHDQLQHAVRHDPLTQLPNRMGLSQHMDDLGFAMEQDTTLTVAVLTIDLNLFKQINDLHGHHAGDIVLTTTAARLAAALSGREFVARTGGDEFIAIKQGFRRIDQVTAFAERLLGSILEPVVLNNISVNIGAAIGIATSLTDGSDLDSLQKKSDQAMYRAKSKDQRHICHYNEDLDKQSQDKLQLIHDMQFACENGEMELVYQLQNDLSTLEPNGFEALLRWNHPVRGLISPADFIPIAEETGHIRSIGLWVLRTACFEAAKWPSTFSIAVNVAPQQLVQPSFIENVSDILFETRLPPARLELEVTEESIIDDQANTLRVMGKLKDMGIRIAMDDFGTGYSSLATLQAFPFDKIKIDRSFIKDVHLNKQSAAIVRSTLLLGAALDIPVLAEGVELKDELDFLRAEQCASVQGFYFGKPFKLAELNKIITLELAKSA